jgi:Flp pilus assembly protein TadG
MGFETMRGEPDFRRDSERGFTLMTTSLCLFVIISMMGLAVDLGRVYISRNEAQTFTDAAALAAATRLNGTSAGITAAQNEVDNNPNRWNFATSSFSGVTTEYTINRTTWYTSGTAPAGSKFVRVTAPTNSVGIYFLRVLGLSSSMNVASTTTAGIQTPTTAPQGVFPFAPLAKDVNGPNYGYTEGQVLTLLWPSSVGSNGNVRMNNLCPIDQNLPSLNAVQAGTTADRGYIQATSASAIAAAIEDDHMDYTVTVGQAVSRSGGVKSQDVNGSVADRVAQDSSSTGPSLCMIATPDPVASAACWAQNKGIYDSYKANHDAKPNRRVVVVPIISNATDATALGFVKVFLPKNQPNNPNDAKCAMYIGPADDPSGKDGSGTNIVRIIQ